MEICGLCGKEFDEQEERARYDELTEDIMDWGHSYSGLYCAECEVFTWEDIGSTYDD